MFYERRKETHVLSVYCNMMVMTRLIVGLPIGNSQLFKLAENVNSLGVKRGSVPFAYMQANDDLIMMIDE